MTPGSQAGDCHPVPKGLCCRGREAWNSGGGGSAQRGPPCGRELGPEEFSEAMVEALVRDGVDGWLTFRIRPTSVRGHKYCLFVKPESKMEVSPRY